jgi:hypothetical protein
MIHSFLGTGLRCPNCERELNSDIDDAHGTEILSCRCGHEESVVQVKDTVEDWKRWCAEVRSRRSA